ncbi:MAG: hypothetical protein QNJ13_06460 [Paracoccaceae bacterium]|nr:hypothetical protein [Paracoccaceae bacterium]
MRLFKAMSVALFLGLAACGTTYGPEGPPMGTAIEVNQLEAELLALGPDVDPEEARRAAEIAYSYTHRLALEYEITDPPLIHNTKVNMGLKPRGLCWHWAEDMENRMRAENFETLDVHRAIANADNHFRIDHSTAILSAKGDAFDEGVVLDPWRKGGILFWSPLLEDEDYVWVEQSVVHAKKRAEMIARAKREGLM